jgi:hypothetical protein
MVMAKKTTKRTPHKRSARKRRAVAVGRAAGVGRASAAGVGRRTGRPPDISVHQVADGIGLYRTKYANNLLKVRLKTATDYLRKALTIASDVEDRTIIRCIIAPVRRQIRGR